MYVFYACNLLKETQTRCANPAGTRSRGSTLRTKTRPLGREDSASVRLANAMVGRVVILLLLCQARKIWWMMEQPVNSLLEHHPLFQMFLKMPGVNVRRLTTSMLWFGGKTRKPTWIYSSAWGGISKYFSFLMFFIKNQAEFL